MSGHLMLVSSDDMFYGSSPGDRIGLRQYFDDVIVGNPSEELLQEIRRTVAEHNILGIVTRGSWMIFLKEKLTIPVFPIKIDSADIYRSLDQLSRYGYHHIGIAVYAYFADTSIPYGYTERYCTGNLILQIAHASSLDEIEYVVDQMTSVHDVDYILGDVEAIQVASTKDIPCGVISIENRFMIDSIEQARYIVQLSEAERIRHEHTNLITNLISELVLSFDSEGMITNFNSNAMAVLQIPQESPATIESVVGLSTAALLKQPANKLIDIRGKNYIMNITTTVRHDQTMHTLILNNSHYIQKIEMSIRTQSKENGLKAKHHFPNIIAIDDKSLGVVATAKKYAQSQGTILIGGETGTGKEIFANSIHNESPRKDGPFVALNCATLSETLIESELFGYEKGAFTGARSTGKKGLFELAHRGTIFLDEIGELPLKMQTKLLRVLQEREIMRIGGDRVIPIDVRIIAATNRNLHSMMEEGSFREDLFYRLALLELQLLPLRERPKDIIPLFLNFLNNHMQKNGLHFFWDNIETFEPLLSYDWPGNIRELENLAERVVLLSDQSKITWELISSLVREKGPSQGTELFSLPITDDLQLLEHRYICYLLDRFDGNRAALCQYLKISRPTLWRKLNYEPKGEVQGKE